MPVMRTSAEEDSGTMDAKSPLMKCGVFIGEVGDGDKGGINKEENTKKVVLLGGFYVELEDGIGENANAVNHW